MGTKSKKLLESALKLPRAERAEFAAQLWNSLDEQEWLDEVEARIDEVKSGRVKPVPFRTAFARLRKAPHGSPAKR